MARKALCPPSGHTILVVDDQEEALASTRQLLEREGHRVLSAPDGSGALELFTANDVHLLVVDYFMPAMSGEEVIRRVRQIDPFVQIILQTGYAGEKPARTTLGDLDIQGYHDKGDGPERLLVWVDVGLKAYRLVNDLRERERVQQELVANVSHELRTPLTTMGGYTDLLLDDQFGELPAEARRPLRRIAAAANHLSTLVEDFLKYAKVTAGVFDFAEKPVEMRALARELHRLATLLIDDGPVRFTVDLHRAPAAILSDPVKLRTILRNVVTNAVKFTGRGQITLQIVRDGGWMHFAVSDTGPGIRTEDLELIFEPFRQIDGSATRRHGGVGLGLALARKLARVLGGDLTVRSTVGQGSTFRLSLPARGIKEHRPAGAAANPAALADWPALHAAGTAC